MNSEQEPIPQNDQEKEKTLVTYDMRACTSSKKNGNDDSSSGFDDCSSSQFDEEEFDDEEYDELEEMEAVEYYEEDEEDLAEEEQECFRRKKSSNSNKKNSSSPSLSLPAPKSRNNNNKNKNCDPRSFASAVATYSTVDLQKDEDSNLAFLFDVSNVTNSAKHFLAMPLNALAVNLPGMMASAASYGSDESNSSSSPMEISSLNKPTTASYEEKPAQEPQPKKLLKFKAAFGFDNDIDRGDQNSAIARNFHDALRSMGIELSLFTAKKMSAIQRAVDVALGVKLLDLCDVIVKKNDDKKEQPSKMHVVLFSSDGDLEPAIDMALERNPRLQITVVCDKNSTSKDYLRWMENRRFEFEKDPKNQRRLHYVFLSALATSSASFINSENFNDEQTSSPNTNKNNKNNQQQQSYYKHLLGPQQILEIRRKDYPDASSWIAAMETQVLNLASSSPSSSENKEDGGGNPIVLRINQDDVVSDQDLSKFAQFVQTSPNRNEFIKNIRQLWFDHTNIGLSSGKKTSQAIVEICEGLSFLRELHASHSHFSCDAFEAIATSMIKSGRTLYINAASTPASYRPEISTKNFTVGGNRGFSGKTVKVYNNSIGNGSVNARFVGAYRERREARINGDEDNFEEQVYDPLSSNQDVNGGGRRGRNTNSRRGNKGKNKNQEYKQKRKYERLAENDFTIDELLTHLATNQVKNERGRGRGGRGRGRGNVKNHDVSEQPQLQQEENNNTEEEAVYYRGRGGRGRGGRGRGRK